MHRGSTIQTKMSLATAGIYCTISPPLSGAMENCSVVRVQQLAIVCRRRCCMSASQRVFGSRNVVVAHEHRRQDGSRWLGTKAKCQTVSLGRGKGRQSSHKGPLVATEKGGIWQEIS